MSRRQNWASPGPSPFDGVKEKKKGKSPHLTMGEGSGPFAEGGRGAVHTLENKVSAGSKKSSADK